MGVIAASAAAILASSHMGFGLSTTQVCSGSIVGTGVGRRPAEVRWSTARRIVYGWLLTLPAAAVVGAWPHAAARATAALASRCAAGSGRARRCATCGRRSPAGIRRPC